MTRGSTSDAAVASRRRRVVLALVALVLLLIAVVVATRQSAPEETGINSTPLPAADNASPSAGASDCEEEPPPTSFTLAECGADEGSEPAAQTP